MNDKKHTEEFIKMDKDGLTEQVTDLATKILELDGRTLLGPVLTKLKLGISDLTSQYAFVSEKIMKKFSFLLSENYTEKITQLQLKLEIELTQRKLDSLVNDKTDEYQKSVFEKQSKLTQKYDEWSASVRKVELNLSRLTKLENEQTYLDRTFSKRAVLVEWQIDSINTLRDGLVNSDYSDPKHLLKWNSMSELKQLTARYEKQYVIQQKKISAEAQLKQRPVEVLQTRLFDESGKVQLS